MHSRKTNILESMDFPDPVISISIKPESNADNEKLGEALHRLADEDPTFTLHTTMFPPNYYLEMGCFI